METDRIDLGYNDDYFDHCDYIDYNEITTDKKTGTKQTLTVMQLNTSRCLKQT